MNKSTTVRTCVFITVGAVAFVGAGATNRGEGSGHEEIVAYFTDASPLDPGSQVRAAGVQIGKVTSIKLDGGMARVTLQVDDAVLPLHKDARLKLRPVNLLGENFVELNPGSATAPVLKSQVVPASQTDSSVTLQDLLDTFDDPTSASLAALITAGGEGLKDSGSRAAAALRALAPSMNQAQQLGDVLTDQNELLQQLIDQASPAAQAVSADQGHALDRLVDGTALTLSTLAANRESLDQTIAQLPATLRNARQTLSALAGVSDAATPALRSIRPLTENLVGLSAELLDFSAAADPALASLKPVLDEADELLTQAAPVAEQLRAAGGNLQRTAAGVRPLGVTLLDRNLFDLMEFVRKWSLSTNGRDALSHYFRGVVHATPRTLLDLAGPLIGSKSTAEVKPNQGLEGLTGGLGTPLNNTLNGVLGGLGLLGGGGEKKSSSDSGATGLTQQQEQSLLGQLLGGL